MATANRGNSTLFSRGMCFLRSPRGCATPAYSVRQVLQEPRRGRAWWLRPTVRSISAPGWVQAGAVLALCKAIPNSERRARMKVSPKEPYEVNILMDKISPGAYPFLI